jgi:ribosomal protein S16
MRQLYDPVLPSTFLAWAQRVGLPIEPALLAAVEAAGVQIAEWQSIAEMRAETIETYISTVAQLTELIERLKSSLDEKAQLAQKDVSTRERDSLLKLVIGMAVKGYAYDPMASRNSATADIASDLASLGIGLDTDTIRKWLKEGADLLPGLEEQDP